MQNTLEPPKVPAIVHECQRLQDEIERLNNELTRSNVQRIEPLERAVQAEYFKEQEQRENAMLRRALADALSTFQHKDEVIVTTERLEAWKAALTNGGQLS